MRVVILLSCYALADAIGHVNDPILQLGFLGALVWAAIFDIARDGI